MTFDAIPAGIDLYVDANVFIYDFSPHPQFGAACRALLQRIEDGEINAYISAQELSDVAHRLMTVEACQTLGWPYPGIAQRLRSHPAEIGGLTRFQQAVTTIVNIGVKIVPVTEDLVLAACDLSRRYGLLSNDALISAVMAAKQITNIASSDSDFDRVPGISRYQPV